MRLLTLLSLTLLAGCAAAATPYLTEKWNFDTRETAYHVFTLNLDANPSKEIITGAERSGKIFALEWTGTKIWEYNVPGLLFDLYARDFQDNRGEIVGGSFTRAYSITGGGDSNWKYFTQHNDVVSVFLDDLDGDGGGEAVIGSVGWRGNAVIVLDENGSEVVTYGFAKTMYPYVFDSLDVDGDGIKEIAVGFTGYSMNTLTSSLDLGFTKSSQFKLLFQGGDEVFSFDTVGGIRSLKIADVTGDGVKEILIGSNKRMYVLDKSGKLLWEHITGDVVYDMEVADVDGDGKIEVLAGSDKLYVIKDNGVLAWKSKTYQGVYAVEVVDLEGDGVPEIVTGTSRIVLYDNTGGILWSSDDVRSVTDLEVDDLDNDKFFEVILTGTDGKLRVFDSESYAKKNRAEKLLASAKDAYLSGEYSNAIELAGQAKTLFQDLTDSSGASQADTVATNSRNHVEADAYLNESLGYYRLGEYKKAGDLASKAGSLYSQIKDVQSMDTAMKLYEASQTYPNADNNYSTALRLREDGFFRNASDHARRALSAYTWLNDTDYAAKSEELLMELEKYAEAEDYYGRAEELYLINEQVNASVYLEKAKRLYSEVGYAEGLSKVDALSGKISQTKTLRSVIIAGGVGLVLVFIVGVVLMAVAAYIIISRKRKKKEREVGLESILSDKIIR